MRSVFFLLFFIHLGFLFAQPAAYDTIILRHFKEQNLASLSVGLIENGKISYTKSLGMANLETLSPATDTTVYKIGSLSKQFIAAAVVKLAWEGKLSLTDPVNKFFPDAPGHWKAITVTHLLNHISGLRRESPAFDAMENKADLDLIRASYGDTLVFETGTRWQYCNLGYFMLAEIVRQVSGQAFSTYMEQQIFQSAGLLKTRTTTVSELVPARADGYWLGVTKQWLNSPNYIALRPSGAFLSTIPDLLKWELAIQQNQFLSKEAWSMLWRPGTPTGNKQTDGTGIDYGLGWNVSRFKNHLWVYHGGSLPGFRAIYYRFPEENNAILILSNTDHANLGRLANDLAELWY